jgi:hypothetical protein
MSDLSSEARAILDAGRRVDDPSDEDRRRVRRSLFGRIGAGGARAAGAAGAAPRVKNRWRGFGLTVTVALVAAAAAVSAAGIRARQRIAGPSVDPQAAVHDRVEVAIPHVVPQSQEKVPDQAEAPAKRETPAHAPAISPHVRNERYALELKVLQPARAAVARDDFSSALVAIDEHERRFPDGQLAEEREALRVQALLGLQRTEEASRAADAFRERFPGSVLLSRMRKSLHP